MKNSTSKGILFYLLLLVGVVFGIACILACIVIFSPGVEIFGISYFANNTTKKIETFNVSDVVVEQSLDAYISDGRIQTINFETNFVTINIKSSESNAYYITIDSKDNGLSTNKDTQKLVYSSSYDTETKTYTLKAMGPESFFYFGKNSEITLHVPRQKNFANTSLSFKTETGSISIGNNEKDDFTVKNITADVGNGYFLFNSLADISPSASMNIKSQGGTVVVEGKLTMDQLNVESENSKITIHDIVGNVNITTKDSNVSVGNITGDLYYSADAGLLKSKNISGNFEASELVNIANIFVDEIGGKVLIPASKSSNIEIKKVCDNLRINTENGSVKIGEICANAEIITKNGSITCLVNSNQTSNIILTTESGNIDARYKNIDGTSTITTTRGKVYFQFASGEVFELAYSCDKNKPNVNSITTSDYSNSGSFAIGYDAESTCPNKVTITNKEGRSEFDNNLREDYDVFK